MQFKDQLKWRFEQNKIALVSELHGEILFKGKVYPKNWLIADVASDEIGKNAIDRLSIPLLVLKIFIFKVQKLVIWRPPS